MSSPALNKGGRGPQEAEKDEIEELIAKTKARLEAVEAKLNSGDLTSKEEWKYTDAFTKLAGTLRSLYALKLGHAPPEEDGEDLVKMLSDLDKDTSNPSVPTGT
jgi:hypothetical protein